jgi:hypothetical protein
MDVTKEQLSGVFVKHFEREKGLQGLMELMIESMMMSERREFLEADPANKALYHL